MSELENALSNITREAWRMRAKGYSWRLIGTKLRVEPEEIRNACYPERIVRKPTRKKRPPEVSTASVGHAENASRIVIPDFVLRERERRLELAPVSLTAALCGDPAPGRSALDKRGRA